MPQPAVDITLLIPSPIDPVPPGILTVPTTPQAPPWHGLVRRAAVEPFAPRTLEAALFNLFGIDTPRGSDLPVAPVSRLGDMGTTHAGWWLRADPVHLVPDRNQLVMADPRFLLLRQDEADQLVYAIESDLQDLGWQLQAVTPARWYLNLPYSPQISTRPLADVIGRPVDGAYPEGPEATHWRQIINEVQMVLHGAEPNQIREAEGRPTINSVWFWGGGVLPRLGTRKWTCVWSGEPVAKGLARHGGVPLAGLPTRADQLLAAATPGEHLVVLGTEVWDVPLGGHATVDNLETDWIKPLLAALRQGRLAGLTLFGLDGRRLRLNPDALAPWWRPRFIKVLLYYKTAICEFSVCSMILIYHMADKPHACHTT